MSDSLRPHGLKPDSLFCPWNFTGKNTGVTSWFPLSTPGDLPNPGMKPAYLMCPALTAGFFTTVPLRKSKYVYLIEIRAE